MLKKQVKKKRTKKSKKDKDRQTCGCGNQGKIRQGKKQKKELCLKLFSLEFGAEHSNNYLEIWRDEKGKEPEKIKKLVWEYRNTDDENDKNRMGYVSGAKMKSKAKFHITQKPEKWEQKRVTITGKVSIPGKERLFTFTDTLAKVKNNEIITDLMLANKHLNEHLEKEKPQTQFFDPMTIEWRVRYKIPGSLPKTKVIGVSEHKVYVTFDEPYLEEMEKLYLSTLHWAVSNDGATTKQDVVEKTWQMFAKKDVEGKWGPANITAWDEKRKLYYYPTGGIPEERVYASSLGYCLANQGGYGQCFDFADLFSHSLSINRIPHSFIEVTPTNNSSASKMLIKEWKLKKTDEDDDVSTTGEEYPYEFVLFPEGPDDINKGKMTSPITKEPESEYGDFINLEGIAGQNMKTPSEKVFSGHQIILIEEKKKEEKLLPNNWEPYFDPSYGVTYKNEKDFAKDAVYGYVQFFNKDIGVETRVINDVERLIFKAKPAKASDNFIEFREYPVCCD